MMLIPSTDTILSWLKLLPLTSYFQVPYSQWLTTTNINNDNDNRHNIDNMGHAEIAAATIIDTGYAKFLGNHSADGEYPNVVVYYGIPYAEPPVGERRFRAPVELDVMRLGRTGRKRKGEGEGEGEEPVLVDARSHPEFCIQGGRDNLLGGAGSEDCLKVNIYTPLGAKRDSNLPVLVFFHGGGYTFGNPLNFPFDHWIQDSATNNGSGSEIIIVSVYYRLSSFGYLAHSSFRNYNHASEPHSTTTTSATPSLGDLNAGFLDQVEALRWIQRYISAFGGDQDRVTIDGHSAGASSVELHLVAAASAGGGVIGAGGRRSEGSKIITENDNVYVLEGRKLFTQAIIQSSYRVPVPMPEQQEALFEFYATHAGCGGVDLGATMDCLRKADVSDLARAQDLAMTDVFDNPYKFFRPVIDGNLVSRYPSAAILDEEFVKGVPVLVGSTSNETSIPSGDGDVRKALKSLFPQLGEEDLDEFMEVYPREDFDSEYQHFQVTTGESVFICSVPLLGDAFDQARPKAPVWAYRYNEPNPSMGSSVVAHSAESWMMFRGTNTRNNGTSQWSIQSVDDKRFSRELIGYWLSFVRTGDPNTFRVEGTSRWEEYSERKRMVLQKSWSYIEAEPERERQRCSFVVSKVEREQN